MPRPYETFSIPSLPHARAAPVSCLATVREIVHEHDGAIYVQSVPQQGTKFEIWIPANEPDPASPAPAPNRRGSGQVILLLGSEPNVRMHDEETR